MKGQTITLVIFCIAVLVVFVTQSWYEVITKILFERCNLDRDDNRDLLVVAIVSSLILLAIMYMSSIEAHEYFGLSELVDELLTGTREIVKKSKVVHRKM